MTKRNVEMVGASDVGLSLVGRGAKAHLKLDKLAHGRMVASLTPSSERPSVAARAPAKGAPDRVFLNLENVRGCMDSVAFHVYINLPEGAEPAKHPELLAGNVALFGVRKASLPNGKHAGNGVTFVLDVSHVIDTLHLAKSLDPDKLHVTLVPIQPVPDAAKVTIGRVSIYRQSA